MHICTKLVSCRQMPPGNHGRCPQARHPPPQPQKHDVYAKEQSVASFACRHQLLKLLTPVSEQTMNYELDDKTTKQKKQKPKNDM